MAIVKTRVDLPAQVIFNGSETPGFKRLMDFAERRNLVGAPLNAPTETFEQLAFGLRTSMISPNLYRVGTWVQVWEKAGDDYTGRVVVGEVVFGGEFEDGKSLIELRLLSSDC